jgi:hypothetical protein
MFYYHLLKTKKNTPPTTFVFVRAIFARRSAATRPVLNKKKTQNLGCRKKEMETTLSEFLAANPCKTLEQLFPGYFQHA